MSDPSSSTMRSASESLPQFPIELTDADATLQVHSIVPPAGDTEQELCEDDLVVDEDAGDDALVAIAAPRAPVGRPPPPRSVPIRLPPPTLPYRRSMTSSISPMALDPLPPPSRRRADSTALLPRAEEHRELRMLLLGAAAAALAVLSLASLGTTVVYSVRASTRPAIVEATSPLAATRVAAPKTKELLSTLSVLAPPPEPEPSPAPPPVAAAATVAPSASVVTTAAPATLRTGVLRVPPSIHGILVDGKPRRVDGSTVLSCGRHAIKSGITPARNVDVPCGGTAWL
jgi:hypothetical protein